MTHPFNSKRNKKNHFIEVANGDYLIIHSGSRNFGKSVCDYYARQGQWHEVETSGYIKDMRVAQQYASYNRKAMARAIGAYLSKEYSLQYEDAPGYKMIHSTHNYIGGDNIIRKGAISARLGEEVVIPLNMRDGSIIGVGKGNAAWNNSAPHGAGRIMSRSQAKKNLSMDEFRNTMSGIYSTSVSESTLDEAPMAYKDQDEILSIIDETVEVKEIVRPIYNFKA